ncbi:helix-turn-helix domain-containing protein [Paenactinomyces guangxiensis]|uniref:Helix-turn-helix domain-containing protein n=1 Tax=Paenactinomyces guangxiensis TaxID=1490290 RepID=A0A7W2A888_9BACL|nr:helix-turn-helix transcriptional regulator [Paenactinomyces guangxiensis]MBA4494405.1 helix-turn-helix domain-containing protein [Paenactinomyces guangxiensis]MBH8591540.1 helix-turn-helix domain-containing protein [Paenactinomyces guangxiensis]
MGVGIVLKQARERIGYSLEEMNRITNIHTEYLHALENDRFDQLPSPFYARAFLRAYAKSLGLEVQPLLDTLEKVYQNTASYQAASVKRGQGTPNDNYDSAGDLLNSRKKRSLPPGTEEPADYSLRTLPAPNQVPSRQRLVRSPESQPPQSVNPTYAPVEKGLPVQNGFPNLPKPDPSAQTLSPRRVAIEAKQGQADAAEKENKKGKKPAGLAIGVAVAALLLVGGVGAYVMTGDDSGQTSVSEGSDIDSSPIDTSVNANGKDVPILMDGGSSENEYEGQLYTISNVNKLEVKVKGKTGESVVMHAPSPKESPKIFTLRVGQEVALDTGGKNEIWFRLSVPSNVEVTVNGQTIRTDAQDTQKSYRVQLKK